MKVVITGVTGLIGSALAQSLRGSGHEVLGVSRSPGANTVVWDLDEGSIDVSALEDADVVVHLAGERIDGRWTSSKKRRIRDSRIVSTALLADTLARLDNGPRAFVSGSAVGWYGETGQTTIDESAAGGDDFLARVCRDWEDAARPAAEAGIRVVHPRTGVVLTGTDGALKPMQLATRFFVGGPLGSGGQMWSWISLDDQVAALEHLITADLEGPVNLTAPNPVSQGEIARELARQMRRPSFMPAPRFAVRLVLGEMADALIFQSCAAVPSVLESDGFTFSHPTIAGGITAALT